MRIIIEIDRDTVPADILEYARTNPESFYERFEDDEDLNIIDDALFIAANEKGFDAEEYIKEAFWFEYDGEPGSEIRSAAIAWIRDKNE